MFKRIFWMGTGMAVGAGSAFWAKHKVEATIEQYLPEQVVARVGTSTRDLSATVRAAAIEGREAMRATEAELRARVDARTFVGPVVAADAASGSGRTSGGGSRAAVGRKGSGARRVSRVPSADGPATTARRRARR